MIQKRTHIHLALLFFMLMTSPVSWAQERQLRYQPDSGQWVCHNGKLKHNRALYGGNSGFRVETGDVPEFAFYLPGMGGNIHFGVLSQGQQKWLNDFDHIESRFEPGKRSYLLTDSCLGKGQLKLTVLALYQADGLVLQIAGNQLPRNLQLVWVYGGAAAKRFSRNGDLNADPADCFDLKPSYCAGNEYRIRKNRFSVTFGQQSKHGKKHVHGTFPASSSLQIGDALQQGEPRAALAAAASDSLPMLVGQCALNRSGAEYLLLYHDEQADLFTAKELAERFAQADADRLSLVNRIKINTPDPYLNALGGLVSLAADGIWDGESFQHGAVGWRIPLAGWRGAYAGDVLGWHDRARKHFSAYALSQVTEPATGPVVMDTLRHLARAHEKLGTQLFSSGYICRKPGGYFKAHHYDMNLCYIDELLWHFNWTGDWDYVKEMWPVIKRHLAWEKRNFDPDGDGLYDAYACIWASDALQYSSGGVTHATAYNYRANQTAAYLAKHLGEDPTPYQQEADGILRALNRHLWMPRQGWWAEYQEFFERKQLHTAAAVWTVYHALDSKVHDSFQAYQALRYIDTEIPHIPLKAKGLEPGYQVVSTTNWMPYSWSINNVAFAEVLHTSLAYWQGGRKEKAFSLWKSGILDAMYLGSSPGNIVQISYYDAARGETYRDFADPTGMFARSMVQGLFGIQPDALNKRVVIAPGLPAAWEHATFESPDVAFAYQRQGHAERYRFKLVGLKGNRMELQLPALRSGLRSVTLNGNAVAWHQKEPTIGAPVLVVDAGLVDSCELRLEWYGGAFTETPDFVAVPNTLYEWTAPANILAINDPQQVLSGAAFSGDKLSGTVQGLAGHRTVFVQYKQGDFICWQPLHIEIREALVPILLCSDSLALRFGLRNNLPQGQQWQLRMGNWDTTLYVDGGQLTDTLLVPANALMPGRNRLQYINPKNELSGTALLTNWNLPLEQGLKTEAIELTPHYNARISDIFKNKYLSPRSPHATLQLPWQGIGEWCHPHLTANVDASGLMQSSNKGRYTLPTGIPFWLTGDTLQPNILYTSLWDNYPDSATIELTGKARHVYMLMAGTTNHMQSRFVNARVRVVYADGTQTELPLINPESWCPIEQDYYHDGLAFTLNEPRPWRVGLKTGLAFRNAEEALSISGVYTRQIDGGAATVVDLPLDPTKELDRLVLVATAYEVVVGVTALTLVR